MSRSGSRPSLGSIAYYSLAAIAGSYFAIAGVQGDYGLFRRIQVEAETQDLAGERAGLEAEVARLANRTHRMSDEFLDLDLLDEQARKVLGYVRPDELVVR